MGRQQPYRRLGLHQRYASPFSSPNGRALDLSFLFVEIFLQGVLTASSKGPVAPHLGRGQRSRYDCQERQDVAGGPVLIPSRAFSSSRPQSYSHCAPAITGQRWIPLRYFFVILFLACFRHRAEYGARREGQGLQSYTRQGQGQRYFV